MGADVDARRVSCAAMLHEIVELAITRKVDAVAISGDLVDQEDKFYEAVGAVERALKRLDTAGIDAFAVSGNHDHDVLPRLADSLSSRHFHLLGRGGTWEKKQLVRQGQPVLNVLGWSFPAERVQENPLSSLDHTMIAGAPTLALLHADLDQPGSVYAPVSLNDLLRVPVAGWLLGHIHRPQLWQQAGSPLVLYPGSPQGMDPGETGAHGPWILEIDSGGRISPAHLPICKVRYDTIEMDLTGIDTREAFDANLVRHLKWELQRLCAGCDALEQVCCRVRLVGRTRLHRTLPGFVSQICEEFNTTCGSFGIRIDHIDLDTRPAVDLELLARGADLPAELARLILQLEQGGEAVSGLLSTCVDRMSDVSAARAYQQLSDPPATREAARTVLLRQGMQLLDALLAQKEVAL